MTNTKDLKERLRALAAYLPVFERPGFTFGTAYGFDEIEPGVLRMPCVALSDSASDFVRDCYAFEWVIEFDWQSWCRTDDAQKLAVDRDRLKGATVEDLTHLITSLVRQDRLCDGTLSEAHDSGLLTTILQRADQLAKAR
jgi:hypothetical protein